MTAALRRRLANLEQKNADRLRRRFVWWNEGEPEPQAEPGEQLRIYRWRWSGEEPPEPLQTARQAAP
jgi:hypothetical protein